MILFRQKNTFQILKSFEFSRKIAIILKNETFLGISNPDFGTFLQIDIFYSMSIVGTLCFPDEESDVINDAEAFFEAITEIQPTVFFGPPSAYERIYHHFR